MEQKVLGSISKKLDILVVGVLNQQKKIDQAKELKVKNINRKRMEQNFK